MKDILLETAVFNLPGLLQAISAGTDRIELCSNYHEGGITPSAGMLKWVAENISTTHVFPIIRPRGGSFIFSEEEWQIMENDIRFCRDLDYPGVVIGALSESYEIPSRSITRLIELAYPMEVTFHRAFDHVKDKKAALRQLKDLGCQRVLTSGGAPTAETGIAELRQLVEWADGDIIILAGGGIRAANLDQILKETGVTEVHSAALNMDKMTMALPEIPDPSEISAMLEINRKHSKSVD